MRREQDSRNGRMVWRHALSLILVGVLVWLASGGGIVAQSGGNYFDKITVGGDIDHYGSGVIRDTLDQSVQARVTSGGWNLIGRPYSPNIYGGYTGNAVLATLEGAFIGGGGTSGTETWGTALNVINGTGDFASIVGGLRNTISARYASIGGGHGNTVEAVAGYATIGGGTGNTINGQYGTIGGGSNRIASGGWATIGGGYSNYTSGAVATIAGGDTNYVAGGLATIGGGAWNTIGTGDTNKYNLEYGSDLGYRLPPNFLYEMYGTATGDYSVIAGGQRNAIGDPLSFVGGGRENWVAGMYTRTVVIPYQLYEDETGCMTTTTTIACPSRYNIIVGGKWNEISNAYVEEMDAPRGNYCQVDGFASIGGGAYNTITGTVAQGATVAGGVGNTITATYGTVSGGITNTVTGLYGTIPGGYLNTVSADYGFAAGYRAAAAHRGAFVWADSTDAVYQSVAPDSFNVRASGGVTMTTSGAGLALDGPVIVDGMAFTYTAPITITGVLTNVRLLFYQMP